jgi:hypothetical protein
MDNRLLIKRLRAAVNADEKEASAGATFWAQAVEVLDAHSWEDEALDTAIRSQDSSIVRDRIAEWEAGRQPLVPSDRTILKRALKAFRKRLKLHRLDEESSLGGGPFSSGRQSSIAAIQPPPQYPEEVWEELCLQKRIEHTGQGLYELIED